MLVNFNQKLVLIFNNFYIDFIKDLKKCSQELKDAIKKKYKVVEKSNPEYFTTLNEKVDDDLIATCIKTNPSNLLSNDQVRAFEIVPDLTVDKILSLSDASNQDILKCYVYIFMTLAYIHRQSDEDAESMETIGKTLSILKTVQDGNDDEFEKLIDDVLDDDLVALLKHVKESFHPDVNVAEDEDVVNLDGSSGGIPDIDPSLIENTKIGSLAKEICGELDPDTFTNIKKPEDIMDMNNIGNIVNKVGAKIQSKLASGELQQQDLVNEAFSFINTLGKGAGGSGGGANPMANIGNLFNNPMVQNMVKSLGGGMMPGANVRVNDQKLKNMATADRLRRKLDEKKKSSSN